MSSSPPRDTISEATLAELRAWLTTADPGPERGRRAWQLAAQLCADELPPGAGETASVGVRRHLLDLLMARDEVELVEFVARDEPEPSLRAAACELLARRMAEGDSARVPALVECLGDDHDPDVLLALVTALPVRSSPLIEAGCRGLLERATPPLRVALIGRGLASGGSFATAARERLFREETEVRGPVLQAWIARTSAAEVLRALRDAPLPVVAEALSRSEGHPLAWADVAPLAARGHLALDPQLMPHATTPEEPACRSFLVAAVTRALDPHAAGALASPALRLEVAQTALGRLDATLDEPPGPDPILAVLLEAAERVLSAFDPAASGAIEHHVLARLGRLRHRLARRSPDGWLGAAFSVARGTTTRLVVDHTAPDSASTVALSVADAFELRAPAALFTGLARLLRDTMLADELGALRPESPVRFVDPEALVAALDDAPAAHSAFASDLTHLATLAANRGAPIRVEFEEGWDPDLDALSNPRLSV